MGWPESPKLSRILSNQWGRGLLYRGSDLISLSSLTIHSNGKTESIFSLQTYLDRIICRYACLTSDGSCQRVSLAQRSISSRRSEKVAPVTLLYMTRSVRGVASLGFLTRKTPLDCWCIFLYSNMLIYSDVGYCVNSALWHARNQDELHKTSFPKICITYDVLEEK